MSNHATPIVPTVLYVAEQHYAWKLAEIERLATKYHTPTTVFLAFGTVDASVKPTAGKQGATKQQTAVYCVPDDAAWDRIQTVRAQLQETIDAFAAMLREFGSYAKRLQEAGGIKSAPNPLSPTVIMADDPDDDDHHYFVLDPIVRISREHVTSHTPKMLHIERDGKPWSTSHQRNHFVCPSDDAWDILQTRQGFARDTHEQWQQLLRELGTYQAALADGRYAKKEAFMQTTPAPARVRPAGSWGDTDIGRVLMERLEAAGYHWEMAKQTPDGRWHHLISSRNTALLRNDQVLMRRERLEALLTKPIEQQPTVQAIDRAIRTGDTAALAQIAPVHVGVPMMDQAEAREFVTRIKTRIDLARGELLELKDREGWKALGYRSWGACARAEFGESAATLYRQLEAAEIERDVRKDSQFENLPPIPTSQLQAVKPLSPEQRPEAFKRADEIAAGNPRTAKHVEQAVQEIKPPQPKPATCIRCGAERTPQRSLTTYGAGLVPEYPGRAVTLCSVCIPELLQLRNKTEQPQASFWQALTPSHPTAHLWTKTGESDYTSACGIATKGAGAAPAGSRDGGHCSSCVRATWAQPTEEQKPNISEVAPTPTTITISTDKGPKEIAVLHRNDYLALHDIQNSQEKAITHILSGKRVASFARHSSAGRAFEALAALDWSQVASDGSSPPPMMLAIGRVLVQFEDVDHLDIRRGNLERLEAEARRQQAAAAPEPEVEAAPEPPSTIDWNAIGRESYRLGATSSSAEAWIVVSHLIDLLGHDDRAATIRWLLTEADRWAPDQIEDLADRLSDAEYEALAAYRRDRAVPTLESEGINA